MKALHLLMLQFFLSLEESGARRTLSIRLRQYSLLSHFLKTCSENKDTSSQERERVSTGYPEEQMETRHPPPPPPHTLTYPNNQTLKHPFLQDMSTCTRCLSIRKLEFQIILLLYIVIVSYICSMLIIVSTFKGSFVSM